MDKKAQAAMEFLMTYGWAILVVVAAVAALAYFGILSPDRFLPEKCNLPPGMGCIDWTATTSDISLRIQNSQGSNMDPIVVNITDSATSSPVNLDCVTSPASTTLADGEAKTFTCTPKAGGANLTSGKYKGTVNVYYTNAQTSMAHTKGGELILKVP